MRRSSSFLWCILILVCCMLPGSQAAANIGGSVVDSSQWDVTSYKVKLLDHRGGSGDIQTDQNGWIHLGANHLEGGDIKYEVDVGHLTRSDILEVWIDGYSTSTELDVGPTVFIGTGKNRYEQITRLTGDAWRPFVFRFADDMVYGDVTDPSNRNENWRTRYPSSKYEVRRIDKSPGDLLANRTLPVRVSMTGTEDFIIKRIEVVAYRARPMYGDGVYIVNINPYTVRQGQQVAVKLSSDFPSGNVEFYLIDAGGHERRLATRTLGTDKQQVVFHADDYLFPQSGQYQLKLVDLTNPEETHVDIERFEYVRSQPKIVPTPEPTPPVSCPEYECGPLAGLPPIPSAPPTYGAPMYGGPIPTPMMTVPTMPGLSVVPSPIYQRGGYTIQVGAFQSHASAVRMQEKLRASGYHTAWIDETVKNGKRLYRVRVGQYQDKSLAQQDARRLRNSGFDTWVTDIS
jgi:cell division protein FtsN